MIISRVLRRVVVIDSVAKGVDVCGAIIVIISTCVMRVVVVDNVAKGVDVYGAIIVIINTYVIRVVVADNIAKGVISILEVARRGTNSYNREGFSETIAIIRF